ncbi:MAG: helix-turn-helix domain-containing protein [Terriglobales bacterium]
MIVEAANISAPLHTTEVQPKLLYSKAEAARMLSLSLRTIDYLIATGELTARRVGRRVLLSYNSLTLFTRKDHLETGRPN